MMATLDVPHPGYDFARHKGYGTAVHRAALRLHGPVTGPSLSFCARSCGCRRRAHLSADCRSDDRTDHGYHRHRGAVTTPPARNAAVGASGERVAALLLEREGCVIVARNWRCRGGELDLVALDGETLVCVEVRVRTGVAHGSAAESVVGTKAKRVLHAVAMFLDAHPAARGPPHPHRCRRHHARPGGTSRRNTPSPRCDWGVNLSYGVPIIGFFCMWVGCHDLSDRNTSSGVVTRIWYFSWITLAWASKWRRS